MASYANSWIHTRTLNIAKEHLNALDRTRLPDGKVVGQDNFDRLYVSTVFSALAIEGAMNDFIQSHALFPDQPYLQEFFGRAVERLLWVSSDQKIDLITEFYSGEFDKSLVKDVRRLFKIRNSIVHPKSKFESSRETGDGCSRLTMRGDIDSIDHMLRHADIAEQFLDSFWAPGTTELEQWQDPSTRESRTIKFEFSGGPCDGDTQVCDPNERLSWWRSTGGQVGQELKFLPDEAIDALQRGKAHLADEVLYRIAKRVETEEEIILHCRFVESEVTSRAGSQHSSTGE